MRNDKVGKIWDFVLGFLGGLIWENGKKVRKYGGQQVSAGEI